MAQLKDQEPKEIDVADSESEALWLISEHQKILGLDWKIWMQVKKDHED